MLVTKQLTVAIDFHNTFFHTMEINENRWGPETCLFTFFKISSFVLSRRMKLIQIWKNLRVTIPLNNQNTIKKSYQNLGKAMPLFKSLGSIRF